MLLGLLREDEQENPAAVEAASKKFKEKYKMEASEFVYQNDFSVSVPDPSDRESYGQALTKQFISTAAFHKYYSHSSAEEMADSPNLMEFESLDLYGSFFITQMPLTCSRAGSRIFMLLTTSL